MPGLLFSHVQTTGTMTTLAVDPVRNIEKFIFRTRNKIRQRIVAAHAFEPYLPRETRIESILKTGRQVPLAFLCVKGHGHLVKVTVGVKNMRVGMLARADDVIHFFHALVHGIFSRKAIFHDLHAVAIPERVIPEVGKLIIDRCMLPEFGSALAFGGMIEALPHAGMDKSVVLILVAQHAFLNAHVAHRVVMIEVFVNGSALLLHIFLGFRTAIGHKYSKSRKNCTYDHRSFPGKKHEPQRSEEKAYCKEGKRTVRLFY